MFEVVFERSMRAYAQFGKHRVVRLDGVDRADHSVDDQAKEVDERELIFGVVDLSAEERNLRPVFLSVVEELAGTLEDRIVPGAGVDRDIAGATDDGVG